MMRMQQWQHLLLITVELDKVRNGCLQGAAVSCAQLRYNTAMPAITKKLVRPYCANNLFPCGLLPQQHLLAHLECAAWVFAFGLTRHRYAATIAASL